MSTPGPVRAEDSEKGAEPPHAAADQGGVSSGQEKTENEKRLFSPAQSIVLLVLVCLFAGGLFVVKHRQRLRSSEIVITPGNAEDYAFRIDINSAPWEDISLLPGIGETKARAIVAYRETNGRFRSAGDLVGVPGIGEKTAAGIAEYLVFAQPREPAP